MARTEINRLRDRLEAARKPAEYVATLDFEAFVADTKTVDAVVRRLDVVGEAAKSVETEFRARYPQVPWSDWPQPRPFDLPLFCRRYRSPLANCDN